jgi:tetratricopeptide (TPR) repeat protein/uncharacterized glyoxalase superfamily protein PhnB
MMKLGDDHRVVQLRQWQQHRELDKIEAWLGRNLESLQGCSDEMRAITCLCLLMTNRADEAQTFFNAIHVEGLTKAPGISDYALCSFLLKRSDALELIRSATAAEDADATAWARQGAMLMVQGKLEEAEKCFNRSLFLEPERGEVLANVAGIRARKNDFEQALELYNRALATGAKIPVAEQQRGKVLIQLGKIDDVMEQKLKEIQEQPENKELYQQLARLRVHANQIPLAIAGLMEGVVKFPSDVGIKVQLVETLFSQKMTHQSGLLLKSWLDKDDWMDSHDENERVAAKRDLRLLLNKARIEARFLDAAAEDLEEMEEECGDNHEFALVKARLLEEQGKPALAIRLLEDTIQSFPGLVEALGQLIQLLTSLGRLDEAERYSEQVSTLNPAAVIQFVENHGHKANEKEKAKLRHLLDTKLMPARNRAPAGFTLHKVLEKEKNYDEAFEVLVRANDLIKSTLDYRWENHRQLTQRLMKTFSKDLVTQFSGKGFPSSRPIFVVGMPRSGTTLTEQIIASHSQVFGGGELPIMPEISTMVGKVVNNGLHYPEAVAALTVEDLQNAAKYYLNKITLLNGEAAHVVDKLPHNFDHVGLIALAFPNAKIIQLERDPRDNAISNYQQNFGAWHGTMGFAFDLEWIGHMINDHDRIMAYWKDVFPGRIYTLNYQMLVNNPEEEMRKLIAYCELPWEDQCLEFYANKSQVKTASIRQVRQKMYTSSSEKWRRYEKYLAPLEKILAEGYTEIS